MVDKTFIARRAALFAALMLLGLGSLALGQEGTITLLSGGEHITLLHHSLLPVNSPSQLNAMADHAQEVLAENERLFMLYPGGAAADAPPLKVVEAANQVGDTAVGLGAYELSQDAAAFARAAEIAHFPWLAANISNITGALAALEVPFATTTRQDLPHALGGRLAPGFLLSESDLSTCVFGLVDPAFQGNTPLLGPGAQIGDPVTAAAAMVTACEDAGADLVIALIYLDGNTRWDARIKGEVPGVDVFVVGGTGERFDPERNPAAHLVQTSKGLSLSVQTDRVPLFVGQLDLTVSSKRIFEFGYRQQQVGGMAMPPLVWLVGLGLALVAAGWWALARGM